MYWFIWLAMVVISWRAALVTKQLVHRATGMESEIVFWVSLISVYGLANEALTYLARNALFLPGLLIAAGIVVLLGYAIKCLLRLRSAAPETKDDTDEEGDYEDEDEDYDYEEDKDYVEALGTFKRLEELTGGTDWSDTRRLAAELIDDTLPGLLALRDGLEGDLEDFDERLEEVQNGPNAESRRASLAENSARTQALYNQVDGGVQNAKSTLERLLVLARERRAGTAPDATGEAARLLTETQQTNQLLLAARRETELVGR